MFGSWALAGKANAKSQMKLKQDSKKGEVFPHLMLNVFFSDSKDQSSSDSSMYSSNRRACTKPLSDSSAKKRLVAVTS